MKALQQREKWASKSKKNSLWEKAHERNAKRLLNLIIELEGLWVKMGQYLSTCADVLPEAYIYFLRQLQDSLPPRPLQEIYRNIQKELGKTMDELFSTFDDNPIATASSSEKVLILEYMDGIHLNDSELLEAFGVDKKKVVDEITRAYAHQIYVDGFFNGDPHPGISTSTYLLDFGLTKSISSSMNKALAKMFLASAEEDHVALLSAFAEMGLKLRLDLLEQAMMVTNVFFCASAPSSEALVDAFPGDAVIFVRVLNLLRGLSSTLNVRVVYLDIMRPFAESVLQGKISRGPATNAQWISTPIHSDLEAKLRQLLIKVGDDDKILGIQVYITVKLGLRAD
ncbi:Abc1 family protein [Thalictrum thalictroides]|uniref:Abc1 family protein n=1 Tax=Thalictrum thalictroides TaxID=46969 RepID=A0A7J6VAL5_THATH|nr:Abc1 family protein [Thalictrum thalictroides]